MAEVAISPQPSEYEIEREAAGSRRRLRLQEGRARTILDRAGPGAPEEQLRELIEETWPNRPVEERSDILTVALRLQADRGTVTAAAALPSPVPPTPLMPTTSAAPTDPKLPAYDKALHSLPLTRLIEEALEANPDVTATAIMAMIPKKLGISPDGLRQKVGERLSGIRSKRRENVAQAASTAPAAAAAQPDVQETEGPPAPAGEAPPAEPAPEAPAPATLPERPITSRARLSACSDVGSVEVVQTAEGTWSFHANLGTLDFGTADRLFGELRALVVGRSA
jgi:hypothetical protein